MNFFDLRLPLGWLFTILGVLLVIAGVRPTPTSEGTSPGININLIWGVVMIVFGLVCLVLENRFKRKFMRLNQTSPEKIPKT